MNDEGRMKKAASMPLCAKSGSGSILSFCISHSSFFILHSSFFILHSSFFILPFLGAVSSVGFWILRYVDFFVDCFVCKARRFGCIRRRTGPWPGWPRKTIHPCKVWSHELSNAGSRVGQRPHSAVWVGNVAGESPCAAHHSHISAHRSRAGSKRIACRLGQ